MLLLMMAICLSGNLSCESCTCAIPAVVLAIPVDSFVTTLLKYHSWWTGGLYCVLSYLFSYAD